MHRLYVLGAGTGEISEVTPAVTRAIKECRAVACAPRLLPLVTGSPKVIEMKTFKETFAELEKELEQGDAAILVSGDTGIFSLLPLIKKSFADRELVVLPGLSAFQSLCAKAGESWQGAAILSGHGRPIDDEKILDAAAAGKVVFFCDEKRNPAWLCALLDSAGLGSLVAAVGERLGSPEEKFTKGPASELKSRSFDPLSIVLVINERPVEPKPLLPRDELFIRTEVPMTREEVRGAILGKLRLTKDSVLWDIGAGTGSVTVAAAQLCRRVCAVEIKPEAAALVRENVKNFGLHNVRVYEGSALSLLPELPLPDVVFIGGSGAELSELLEKTAALGPGIRVVVSAVALKTQECCIRVLSCDKFEDFDGSQLSVAHIKTAGKTKIWQALNPVTIFTAVTRCLGGN